MYLLTYMILYRICLHISQSSTAEISCSLYSLVSVTSYLGHRTKPIRRNTIIHTKMGRKERVSDRRVELPRLNIGGERRGTLGMEGVRNHNFVGALTVHTKNQCKRTIIVSNGSSTRVCVHLSPVHQPGDCKKKKRECRHCGGISEATGGKAVSSSRRILLPMWWHYGRRPQKQARK
jgi:hypothetical protein